jgi:hypothetical protein
MAGKQDICRLEKVRSEQANADIMAGHSHTIRRGLRSREGPKPRFADALKIALAVYPEAQVDIERQGLTLHPLSLCT